MNVSWTIAPARYPHAIDWGGCGPRTMTAAAVPDKARFVAAGTTKEKRAFKRARSTSEEATSGIIAKVTGMSSAASVASLGGRPGAVIATRGRAIKETRNTTAAPKTRVVVMMIEARRHVDTSLRLPSDIAKAGTNAWLAAAT